MAGFRRIIVYMVGGRQGQENGECRAKGGGWFLARCHADRGQVSELLRIVSFHYGHDTRQTYAVTMSKSRE